ncbi:MAG TPA: selenocysteine-specific translation elongation factor [Candidatus Cloacimonadota bacterium]|nr:selenocysteine-specific translation elongation factor [Candidatus Cloacimonadota bacterium]
MKHLIMGTAGHIDHGKTSLVKALSGFDCDTHPEEKQRGITIHLGFTHVRLNEELDIGIVDVPGHKAFVNTMISGVSGIDFVILIIAADSGIMPQTREHLQIMQMLNIQKGLIVINKIDLADQEMTDLLDEELIDFTADTFLENCPIIKTSAKTGFGIEELKSAIISLTTDIQSKSEKGIFRQYIDRIFQVKGFGTVVTGTVLSGLLKSNDRLFILPDKKELKIKRLERYAQEVDLIQAGDRASINLAGIDSTSLQKGMLLSSRVYESTNRIDVRLQLFDQVKELPLWSHVLFISGTNEVPAKIHLIDKNTLKPSESAYAQIHLSKPLPLVYQDTFIIRNSSSDISLGGGRIIDAQPLHHRRRTEKLKSWLKILAEGDLTHTVLLNAQKYIYPVSLSEIAEKLALDYKTLLSLELVPSNDNQLKLIIKDEPYFWLKHQLDRYKSRFQRHLQTWHKSNPFDKMGKTIEELLAVFHEYPTEYKTTAAMWVIKSLTELDLIEKRDNTYALKSHKVAFTSETNKALQWTETFIRHCNMQTPLWSEMSRKAKYQNINEKVLKQLLTYLVRKKKAYYIEESYIYYKVVDENRLKLLQYLNEHPEGITVSIYRDLINGNRKICLLLLAIFDIEGIVRRDGDYRFITEKGKQILENG